MNIQSGLKAPKSQFNNFGKYNYRNLEDILEGVKPLLKSEGATLTISDEIVSLGDRFYVKAKAILTDIETGESISNIAYAREELTKKGMDASQLTGSTSSYARKYSLNGLFAIDDSKDADNFDNTNKPQEPTKNQNGYSNTEEVFKQYRQLAKVKLIRQDLIDKHITYLKSQFNVASSSGVASLSLNKIQTIIEELKKL